MIYDLKLWLIGFWPLLWHSAAILTVIAVLALVAFGTITLQGIIGVKAMGWLREACAVAAVVAGLIWIGMLIQHRSDSGAAKRQMEAARVSGIKEATVSHKRAVSAVSRGVCDPRDTDCTKR